jgi:hypothetical protein
MFIQKFEDFNIREIGSTVQISGMIWSGNGKSYLCFLPDDYDFADELVFMPLNLNEWNNLIRQSDIMETEILAKDTEGNLVKTILRKSTRHIDQNIQWKVFQRDNYTCRYCGRTGLPLSVDHIILWEEGGPSIEENLITACKKCNKTRGSQQYSNWLISEYYKVSRNIDEDTRQKNAAIIKTMNSIPRRIHLISR